jgi:hypothetical protein
VEIKNAQKFMEFGLIFRLYNRTCNIIMSKRSVKHSFLFLLVLVRLAAFAFNSPKSLSVADTNKLSDSLHKITITVFDSATAESIPGVLIQGSYGDSTYTTATDIDGKATLIIRANPMRIDVLFTCIGYVPLRQNVSVHASQYVVRLKSAFISREPSDFSVFRYKEKPS